MTRGKPITDPERLEKAWQLAKASAEIEGFQFTPEDERIIKDLSTGKRDIESLINKYKQKKS
ncbi:antitoxin VbhA family protein [Paucisalibacillus globulus]|uniref:antitoxin VbhA family protein n=1 Tax=Paucisalibacillus globulus TaxID=351095 RepID=UPI000BB6C17D|nr:antitoxin VbhA family protein [Paucisalibacillus globulus]